MNRGLQAVAPTTEQPLRGADLVNQAVQPLYLTAEQMAVVLGMTLNAFYKWLKRHPNCPRRWIDSGRKGLRFKRAEVESYVDRLRPRRPVVAPPVGRGSKRDLHVAQSAVVPLPIQATEVDG